MRSSRQQAGYNLVMLMVLLTVLNIMVAATLPAWSAVIRRDKEEELVFRGLQYAEAIRLFTQRFQRPPVRLEELIEVQPRSIRQLWKDPMTESGKWALIPLQGPPGPQVPPGGELPGEDENGRGEGEGEGEGEDEEGEGEDDGFGPPKGEVQVGPFKGVRSKSRKTSFLLFNGKDRYDEWHFTVELFTGAPPQQPPPAGGAPPVGPQVSARWIGRPLPEFLQPRQGSGLPQDDFGDDGNPGGGNKGGGTGGDGRPRGGTGKP